MNLLYPTNSLSLVLIGCVMKAMQAILSNPDFGEEDSKLAEYAYNVADTMLKARGQ